MLACDLVEKRAPGCLGDLFGITPPKSNIDTKNDGFLNVSPASNMAILGIYLEDHPSTCKWLGSPPFMSHEKPIWKGNNPT